VITQECCSHNCIDSPPRAELMRPVLIAKECCSQSAVLTAWTLPPRAELTRITEENLRILRRIQHSEPVLNHLEWQEKARRDEAYLRNCAEYPVVLPSRQTLTRDSIRHTPSPHVASLAVRSRVGADDDAAAFQTHQGFLPGSAPAVVQPGPVRLRQAGADRAGTPPQEAARDGSVHSSYMPDRALLQSRGASREGRVEPAMPSLDEDYGGDEFEK